jgi:hypothetical protein
MITTENGEIVKEYRGEDCEKLFKFLAKKGIWEREGESEKSKKDKKSKK